MPKAIMLVDYEVELYYNENNYETVLFNKGEVIDFDIIDHPYRMINGVFKEDFELLNIELSDKFDNDVMWFSLAKSDIKIIEN